MCYQGCCRAARSTRATGTGRTTTATRRSRRPSVAHVVGLDNGVSRGRIDAAAAPAIELQRVGHPAERSGTSHALHYVPIRRHGAAVQRVDVMAMGAAIENQRGRGVTAPVRLPLPQPSTSSEPGYHSPSRHATHTPVAIPPTKPTARQTAIVVKRHHGNETGAYSAIYRPALTWRHRVFQCG